MLKSRKYFAGGSQESIFEIRTQSVLKLTERGSALLF
jgi:hypothetical protein